MSKIIKTKKWYKSKTIWFNVFSFVAEILNQILNLKLIPPGAILLIVNIVNIILRTLTRDPIKK